MPRPVLWAIQRIAASGEGKGERQRPLTSSTAAKAIKAPIGWGARAGPASPHEAVVGVEATADKSKKGDADRQPPEHLEA